MFDSNYAENELLPLLISNQNMPDLKILSLQNNNLSKILSAFNKEELELISIEEKDYI